MSHTPEQEEKAWMVLSEDGRIKKLDLEKARRMSKDPNPHISTTANVIVQLLDLAGDLAEINGMSETDADLIRTMSIEDFLPCKK